MSVGTFEAFLSFARTPASVLAAGVAIKLMDDSLDATGDRRTGSVTVAARLGIGVLPYCLGALCIALLSEPKTAAALFLGAYALGMAHDFKRTLPTGLKGWHESLIAAVVAVVGAGWSVAVAAFASMAFVQCADDMADVSDDRMRGQANFVNAIGFVETGCLAVASLVVAAGLDPEMTVAVIAAVPIIEGLVAGARSLRDGGASTRARRGHPIGVCDVTSTAQAADSGTEDDLPDRAGGET